MFHLCVLDVCGKCVYLDVAYILHMLHVFYVDVAYVCKDFHCFQVFLWFLPFSQQKHFIFLIYLCVQCTPISREKHRIESGYEVSLDYKNLQVGEDMTNLFILKELFYQTIVADFFPF
jgi:hypothetical protein